MMGSCKSCLTFPSLAVSTSKFVNSYTDFTPRVNTCSKLVLTSCINTSSKLVTYHSIPPRHRNVGHVEVHVVFCLLQSVSRQLQCGKLQDSSCLREAVGANNQVHGTSDKPRSNHPPWHPPQQTGAFRKQLRAWVTPVRVPPTPGVSWTTICLRSWAT
jgi:hypothetical protein